MEHVCLGAPGVGPSASQTVAAGSCRSIDSSGIPLIHRILGNGSDGYDSRSDAAADDVSARSDGVVG